MPVELPRYPPDPFGPDFPFQTGSKKAMDEWIGRLAYETRAFSPWQNKSQKPTKSSSTAEKDASDEKGTDDEADSVKVKENDNRNSRSNIGPDGIQRVLIEPDRTGWARISDMVHKYDEDRIRDVKEDIDTLLVFAGLFSAVLTTFVVETYTKLEPDSGDASSDILLQISLQLASLSVAGSFINSTVPAFSPPPFVAPVSSVRINTLWSCSLVLALITASLAILVKQWFHEYMAHESQSPLSHLRLRFFRHDGLVKWRVFELAAALPMLLQLALLLFFIGLSEFLRLLNPVVGWITTAVMLVWLVLYIFTIFAPVFSPQCPYKTPMLKDAIGKFRALRGYILWLPVMGSIWFIGSPLLIPLYLLTWLPTRRVVPGFYRRVDPIIRGVIGWLTRIPSPPKMAVLGEEQEIRRSSFSDFAILCRSRSLFQDEQLSGTLNQCTPDIDLISALTCVRTYRPQSEYNKTTVAPPRGWMTLLPKDVDDSLYGVFHDMLLRKLECQGVDIDTDASFEHTYESLTSLIHFTSTGNVAMRDFYFGAKPHFPEMFMRYCESGDIAMCTLFMSLYSMTANILVNPGRHDGAMPWRVISASLVENLEGRLAPNFFQTTIMITRALVRRLSPTIFNLLVEERREALMDPYIRGLIKKYKIEMNPLALCYTLAMFSITASEMAIRANSTLNGTLLWCTSEFYYAEKDLFEKSVVMSIDKCWKDCALQTLQAFKRMRKISRTAIHSRLYHIIDWMSRDALPIMVDGLPAMARLDEGEEDESIDTNEIFAPRAYIFFKEPWASEYRREYNITGDRNIVKESDVPLEFPELFPMLDIMNEKERRRAAAASRDKEDSIEDDDKTERDQKDDENTDSTVPGSSTQIDVKGKGKAKATSKDDLPDDGEGDPDSEDVLKRDPYETLSNDSMSSLPALDSEC